jgi:carbon monoxide dehydrogenase subunit G
MAARYRFHSTWLIPAPQEIVREVLLDYARYPLWWPQVRSVESTSEGMLTVCRSALPYCLTFYATQFVLDDGTIAAALHGDLDGVAQVRLHTTGSGTRVEYQQEVLLNRPLLRRFSPLLRPAFRFNHALMMRDGHSGLTRYVAGRM